MSDDGIKLYEAELLWSALIDSSVQVYKNGGDVCKAEIKKIQCPTLILHGDQDALIPLYQPDYLYIAGARLHRYP